MRRGLLVAVVLCCYALSSSPVLPSASGGLIVYEGFDAGAGDGNLSGLAGATSVGFDVAGWGNLGGAGASALYEAAGLSFGSGATTLQAIGGSARVNSVSSFEARISRGLNVSVTGTAWGSYLISRAVNSSSENDVIELLVNQSVSGHDNNAEFVTAAEEYQSSLGGLRGKNNPVFPSYNSGTSISDNTTYLVLFKATNLGGTSGAAEMSEWILTSDQFDNFKPGGLTETELNAATTGSTATDVLQRGTLSYTPGGSYPRLTTADVLMMQVFYGLHSRYDELRLSNAATGGVGGGLDEVTPLAVAEPSTALLASLALVSFCWRRSPGILRGTRPT